MNFIKYVTDVCGQLVIAFAMNLVSGLMTLNIKQRLKELLKMSDEI